MDNPEVAQVAATTMMAVGTTTSRGGYEELFSRHRSEAISELWGWQKEVLARYETASGDAAVELPTGAGKTLVGLLAGEAFRERDDGSVAYLAGNKNLAQQVERQARELGFQVVRFQGPKDKWPKSDVRAYNWGRAIGIMNYWNYINASPGVEPAGMLILDDVHLLEGPLREFFTVAIGRDEPLYRQVLERIVARYPYYGLAQDLLNEVVPPQAPEMLAFPDSAELAPDIRDLLDAQVFDRDDPRWWAWQQIRSHLEVTCWLVSPRAVTFTPYIAPSQTIPHFADPSQRLYLSATVGSVDDLRRRLGTPPLTKLTASAAPRQGVRFVVIRGEVESLEAQELVDAVRPLLEARRKALWLCARSETADRLELALTTSGLPGGVRRLVGDNAADEPFAAEPDGHLVAAGRYDGMDFPDDACRIEILPEIPVATSDLEEFVTAYLRDAPFADSRFTQRVAQALGRCNRSPTDRAVYILTDPEFASRFSERRAIVALPDDVKGDIVAALGSADRPLVASLAEADEFLSGRDFPPAAESPPDVAQTPEPQTAGDEVSGILALWREDYGLAAKLFDAVAQDLGEQREHRAFWLAMRALALQLAARYGDDAAGVEALRAIRAAATAGASNTFFTRLRRCEARLSGREPDSVVANLDGLFAAWDGVIKRYGATGPRFERWSAKLLDELRSDDHDTVARAIARFGGDLVGLAADAPKATSGEHDAHWDLVEPYRTLAFEVKLAPDRQRIVNEDVEQAEGAVRAIEKGRLRPALGLIVTPYANADETAIARLDRVRLIQRDVLAEYADGFLAKLREYRRGWTEASDARSARRAAVETEIPAGDWLWTAVERSAVWVERARLSSTTNPRSRAAVAAPATCN
jgi:RAD3-like DEAD/DEAH box helicase